MKTPPRPAAEPGTTEPAFATPASIAEFLRGEYAGHDHDVAGVVFLDERGRRIGVRPIPETAEIVAAVRAVLRAATSCAARWLVPFSYRIGPEAEGQPRDLMLFMELKRGAPPCGLELLDHLLLFADGGWLDLGHGAVSSTDAAGVRGTKRRG